MKRARLLHLPRPSAVLLVLVMGLPVIWLTVTAVGASAGDGGLAATMLPTALRDTGALMAAVGLLTAILGFTGAWLTTHFDFPGRRMFEWALILPLAIPTYLAAYCYVEFLDFTGPVQQLVRVLTGATTLDQYWFPPIRTFGGAVFVLSLVLYPYVYIACRAFFLMQSGSTAVAARVLGASGWRALFEVVIPLSRPALVVGVTLAMMEVVNDLGAVQYFGINSLTAVIYATWINRSNFGGAAQLAVTIVIVIAALILAEQWARRNRVYALHRDTRVTPPRVRLVGRAAMGALLYCGVLIALAFGVPVGEVVVLAIRNGDAHAWDLTTGSGLTSVGLALAGAALTVAVGWLAARLSEASSSRLDRGAIRIAALGYAIPGTVLALGLLAPLGWADHAINDVTRSLFGWRPGLILSGSVAALLYVYAIRFLAVSHSTLDAGMRKRGDSMLQAARVLGVRGWRLMLEVDLPTMAPALLSAATLVFVESVKELPATLLLRPLGVETLATVVYARANAGQFTQAALPALTIVLAGLVPVILATRLSDRR